ncbi:MULTISPECIES: hypothetical protein [unclassified Microbacterium]|uniref:hypothetical protein n=1 Tax=unclassified Microbacterium TaxID=2609290 RepID=UPI00301AD00D
MSHRNYETPWTRGVIAAAAALVLAATGSLAASAASDGGHAGAGDITWDPDSVAEVYAPADGFYSYAPSVVRDGDTEWIWTCHNDEYRVIKDHIYMTKIVDGSVVESRSVLQASPAPSWDSYHVCDPSVVAGKFGYQGKKYTLAMFYLGNDLDASAHNQVGVAFANDPGGPWVKLSKPIVTFERTDQWGAGQPTAVMMPGSPSKVLLGYTQGDTSTRAYVTEVDLKRAEAFTTSRPVQLPTSGLTGTDGAVDYLNGFDLVYDERNRRFLTVREQHPYPTDNPWWIGPAVQVDSIGARYLRDGRGSWMPVGDIDEALTGFTRNHNAGFARDWSGHLPDERTVTVVFTKSCSSLPTVDDQDWSQGTCDSLYSYDLWSVDGRIGRTR